MSNFNTFTVFDNEISDSLKAPPASFDKKNLRRGSFKASRYPDGHKSIHPALLHELNAQKNSADIDRKPPFSVVVINIDQRLPPAHDEGGKGEEEDVSQEFVTEFNTHIGNNTNKEKAQNLIKKMQRLGGLISPREQQEIDIPAARLGLSLLAGLNHPKYKMEALGSLLVLLQHDSLEKETSINLVNLAITLMKQMNRELMQTEILDVQIKITQVYSLVAELLQRHYAKKHINAITKELKTELIATTKALEALNTQEDQKLNYYSKLALEGVRRLVDDRKELFDLIERFYHAFAAILSFQNSDIANGFQELAHTFKDLDPHIKGAWYNGILILNELLKGAKTDPDKLMGIQVLLREKGPQFNWKFTYAALEAFFELSLHGTTLKIRETAFQGIRVFGPDFPGLISFVDEQSLSKYIDLSPMVHFKKPRRKNPNTFIRYSCVEFLAKIAQESQDPTIKKKAKLILTQRLSLEEDTTILAYLTRLFQDRIF